MVANWSRRRQIFNMRRRSVAGRTRRFPHAGTGIQLGVVVFAIVGREHVAWILGAALYLFPNWAIRSRAAVVISACKQCAPLITFRIMNNWKFMSNYSKNMINHNFNKFVDFAKH